jgi:predicted Zn-dependent peptidase
LTRAQRQLLAQLVFDRDSVTSIAHQLGYFETIGALDLMQQLPAAIRATTVGEVSAVARQIFRPANRTIGWFEPQDETDAAEPGVEG